MTDTLAATVQQIRFALSQLAATNGHHDFEHMVRQLARETISRNILPATGPVSSGGDQGRDFETYRTEIPGQVRSVGNDLGIKGGDTVVFLATLQADNTLSKIASDIESILSGGPPPKFVVAYCEANIPVGKRHSLQERILEECSLHLDIFDGTAISEMLAQNDLFWIAEEYLNLPASVLPSAPARPDWYQSDLRRWRSLARRPLTIGDLVDLSGCLRYATFNEEARHDLPFWLERMEELLRDEVPPFVRSKARYEIAVANLRGLGDLRPADDLVEQHFKDALSADDPAQLNDASILLMYCTGARGRRLTDHREDQIRQWNSQLQTRVLHLLDATVLPGRSCALLEILAWLRVQPDLVAARDLALEYELPAEVPYLTWEEWQRAVAQGSVRPVAVPLIDQGGALDAWIQLIEFLKDAPLFPVDNIAKTLKVLGHQLVDDPRYEEVVYAIDLRVADVSGRSAAAENARDRAMAFYQNDRHLEAAREFHRALHGWFSGETSEGMVLCMLMIAECYRRLELLSAAKYYALAAARIMRDDDLKLFPRAIFSAAVADYHLGAWFSTVCLIEAAIKAHLVFEEDPFDLEKHESATWGLFELTTIRAVAGAADSHFDSFFNAAMDRVGVTEVLDEFVVDNVEHPWWENRKPEEIFRHVQDQLGHSAFSDAGGTRTICWCALGVRWAVHFPNDYETTIVAERLAAVAQIVTADVALADPCLLPTSVTFEVQAGFGGNEPSFRPRSVGKGTTWEVVLPILGEESKSAFDDLIVQTLAIVFAAFADISVRPFEDLERIFEVAMRSGLSSKSAFGTVYDVAYANVINKETFDGAPRREVESLSGDSTPPVHDQLRLPERAGPGYTKSEGVSRAATRYESIPATLRATLPALRSHASFRPVVQGLRDEGWRDWHILLAVLNVAGNHRLNRNGFQVPRNREEQQALSRRFVEPEPENDPVPLDLFNEEGLRQALPLSFPSTLQQWGLRLPQNPVDIDALERLLAARFGYWIDDVPHADPL